MYKPIYVERDKFYSVGFDDVTKVYMLEVIIPSIAWYSRYYRITEEEYQCFNNGNKKVLDELAQRFVSTSIKDNRDRFIRSDLTLENQI